MNALIEPFFYCLLASMIWAPIVFIAAAKISGADKSAPGVRSLSGLVWPAALILAALPVLMAPVAAALGFSLRAPEPLPPMADFAGPALAIEGDLAVRADRAPAAGASLADILRAAAVIYFYSFVMLFILAAVRHIWFAYRLNYAIPADEPKLVAALEHWRARIGVKRRPRYVFSHIVSSVCVYGFFRPVVVMPFNLLDRISIEDAALMGAHEMAHVKRGDVALFALCSVVKAVFWFNPFMHRICACATLAAEQGADALVLARGVNRRQYAQCFVQGLRLAAGARSSFAGELIPSFTPFDKRSRRERLDAILTGSPEKPLLSLSSKLGLGLSAAAAAGLAFAQAAFAVAPPEPREALTVAPIEGKITLGYGKQSKVLGEERPVHEGVDIKAARGEPVRAAGDGKVIDATDRYQDSDAWGKVVVIDHGHGLVTRYAHLDSYVVRKGDKVGAGDVIGAVGSTGKSTGPHLHFEVISDGATIDPTPVVAPVPAALPVPAPTPLAPKAQERKARNVRVAPAADYRLALAGDEDGAVAMDAEGKRSFEEKFAEVEERFREQFEKFDAFSDLDGVNFRINDMDFGGFADFEGLADVDVVVPDMADIFVDVRLSDEELEELRLHQEEAMREAEEAKEEARERIEEVREAQREAMEELREQARERAEVQRELEREMATAHREREREVAEARREREAELAELHREAERVRAEHDHQVEYYESEFRQSEEEILAHREAAIREAKADLEQELAEIERRRKELNATAMSAQQP